MKDRKVSDVMTDATVFVEENASYRDVVELLMKHRISGLPVVDAFQRVTGVVSEADLLRKIEYAGDDEPRLFDRRRRQRAKASARTARDLMSTPPVVVPRGTSITTAARLMDQEDVRRLPVVDDLGRLVGVVSRSDLLRVHLRTDDEIRTDVEASVLRPFLADDATEVSVTVVDGVVTMSGRVDRWSAAELVARRTRQIPGVVDVISTLGFTFDDREVVTPGALFGVG
ncbi:CBS domain-containing protein [Krasilnikovia sp. M28-CT-15]|uniref:CBS domain-containing protein n=1 Tax=Krasilnikovia sp. M28-CT-15 TaxID=3373540 RepID=UPI0038774927